MRRYLPWVGLVARLILGGTLIVAGYLKFDELDKSQMAVRAYELLPIPLANFMGIFLPFFELAIGILLVLGASTRHATCRGNIGILVSKVNAFFAKAAVMIEPAPTKNERRDTDMGSSFRCIERSARQNVAKATLV